MIEIEGKINNFPLSILIDSRAISSYVNTNLVKRCKLVHENILVQLDTWMKRNVTIVVEDCKFTMNGLHTKYNLYIIPYGYYDNFLGINWLESHHVILDFHNKILTYLDKDGNYVQLKCIHIYRLQYMKYQPYNWINTFEKGSNYTLFTLKNCQLRQSHA